MQNTIIALIILCTTILEFFTAFSSPLITTLLKSINIITINPIGNNVKTKSINKLPKYIILKIPGC